MLQRLRSKYDQIAVFAIGVSVSLLVLSPMIWIILTSFKDVKEIYSIPMTIWPRNFVWTNYLAVVKGLPEFPIYFFNTLKVTIGTLILVLPMSAAAGYALARREFPGKAAINVFIIAILAIPYLVFLIPLYIIEDTLNLLDTNMGLILPYAALNLPLGILIMQASYREIPAELEDSARIDGANAFQTWFQVMTPLVVTGLAAVTIFTFVAVWEEYMFARTFMMSTSAQTLAVGLPSLRVESKSWAYGTLSAALTLSLLPIGVVFIVLRKYFVEGVLRGSIKG
ncbi:MAG: carbohydrate ABC transporter permease [Firmicutes bacterium]|jgi:ABC-type glycerol-3-phosphate transport system permease component|nr:carbohydrate ABC transporter permease [Bacillota bacterium]